MNIKTTLRGELVRIVDIDIQGREVYIVYIDPSNVLKTTKIYADVATTKSLAVSSSIDDLITSDDSTNTIKTITYEHHEIHEGDHYFVEDYTTLDENEYIDFCVTTPDTAEWTHMLFNINGQSLVNVNVYEGTTVSAAGTPVSAINSNRNSDNTTSLTIASDCGFSDIGTKILGYSSGVAGANPRKGQTPGLLGRSNEIVLKQNTTYIFRITSGADNNIISYHGNWYEHTNA